MGRGDSATDILYGHIIPSARPLVLADYDLDLTQLGLETYFEEYKGFSGTADWMADTDLLPNEYEDHLGSRTWNDYPDNVPDCIASAETVLMQLSEYEDLSQNVGQVNFYAHPTDSQLLKSDSYYKDLKKTLPFAPINRHHKLAVEQLATDHGQWYMLRKIEARYMKEPPRLFYLNELYELLGYITSTIR